MVELKPGPSRCSSSCSFGLLRMADSRYAAASTRARPNAAGSCASSKNSCQLALLGAFEVAQQHRQHQLVPVGEVPVHGGAGDLGLLGHVLERGLDQPEAVDAHLGGGNQPLARRGGGGGGFVTPAQAGHRR